MSALARYLQASLDRHPMNNGREVSENPAVNEIVEFVHVNPCVDVH